MANRYSLNLVTIVKDGEDTLPRLVKSVRPWVDKCIVVDTGSTDATVHVAKSLGCEVHFFEWCNDFSAARNFALDLSDADWNLVLDADEWLLDSQSQLEDIRRVSPTKPAQVSICNLAEPGSVSKTEVDVSAQLRILPRAIRYQGIVHEQPEWHGPAIKTNIQVGHDGYFATNIESKRGRNLSLLRIAVQKHPDDWYYWFQLGKQGVVDEELGTASFAFEQVLSLLTQPCNKQHRSGFVMPSACGLVYVYKETKQFDKAVDTALSYLHECRTSPDLLFCLADALMAWSADEPANCQQLLIHAKDALLQCLEIGDVPDIEHSVLGRGSILAQHNLALVQGVLNCFEH